MAGKTAVEVSQELDFLVRARYSIIAVQTFEENRVENVLKGIAFSRRKDFLVWNCNKGLIKKNEDGTFEQIGDVNQMAQPQNVLAKIEEYKGDALFMLQDFQVFLNKSPKVDRQVKDLVYALQVTKKTVIITGSYIEIPNNLDKHIVLVDFPMPDRDTMRENLEEMAKELSNVPSVKIEMNEEVMERMVESAMGLTLAEAKNAFAKAVVKTGKLNSQAVPIVTAEKQQIVRKSGILEFYPVSSSMDEIGGLDLLKRYIMDRNGWWSNGVIDFGLPYLKGIVIIGIPGTGKSLTAKTIANYWGIPLLRLDMGKIFDKYVGGSEENIRKALKTAEAVSPSVLWLDEVEKAMASGSGDNGTSRRVLGTFLTWMQEKDSPVFVVCTANKVTGDGGLPPEFLRKGRFDEIFFVDLPTEEELVEILQIHLRKKGRELKRKDLLRIAKECKGYSGAEIEAAINDSLWKVFANRGELTTDIIIETVKETKPLSETMKQELTETREWAKGRVRYASSAIAHMVKQEEVQDVQIEIE